MRVSPDLSGDSVEMIFWKVDIFTWTTGTKNAVLSVTIASLFFWSNQNWNVTATRQARNEKTIQQAGRQRKAKKINGATRILSN